MHAWVKKANLGAHLIAESARSQLTLTSPERRQLESFRRAAREVREASIIAEGQELKVQVVPGDPGYMDVYVQLLGKEPFRSLALALRLVYQQGEPAYFYSVCSLLYRDADDEEVRKQVATLRAQYRDALCDPANQVSTGDLPNVRVFTAQEVLEHWLYGIAFHQDDHRQADVELLASEGARFHWSVHATGLQLAGRILDLDDIVAGVLSESQLPRI